MPTEKLKKVFKSVCEAPSGNGFRIEHFPELMETSLVDECSPHVHSFYEILWFQEGCGSHTVDFIDYDVRPGTVFFLSPGQIHRYDHDAHYRGICIKMCTDFMRNEGTSSGMFLKYNSFYTFDTTPYYHIGEELTEELQFLVNEMRDESQRSGEFGNIDVLKALLRIFMVKVQRHGTQESNRQLDTLKPAHQLFVQFRKLVEQQYMHLHTVQEYADRLNVAVRTLNKSVNECSSMSPLAFINERIILEAKRMVRYSDMMIKEIAFHLGYDDPSYFVKLFKRQTGYLPSEFRETDQVTHCKVVK